MEYRTLPHGGEKIGVIGMGSSVVGAQKEADIIRTVRTAFDLGVNYFDMAGGHASIFPAYGKALKDIRRQVFLQVHFGADYTTGEYGWTTELDEIKRSVAWQLENLQTDYIDFGFIHCLDEEADLRGYSIAIRGDKRKKPEKTERVEDLSAYAERGLLRFNRAEKHSPDMQEIRNQFLGFPDAEHDDGPDAVEGGVYKLNKPSLKSKSGGIRSTKYKHNTARRG